MIPEFPKFKPIELSDKDDIEKITHEYLPYSDFNFVSLWSWDVKREVRISKLNGNLVVRFTDYLTSKPFYSFLGDNKVSETVEKLLELSKKEGLKPMLKLIPKEAADNLIGTSLASVFDQDAFDYVYSVSHLANMNNWSKHSSGKNIRHYTKVCPNYTVKHCSIGKAKKDEYLTMFNEWAKNKGLENYSKLHEHEALERVFEVKDNNIKVVSVYVNNILVGFTIYEILPSNYAISHFAKSNIKHHCAISDILNWEEAKILEKEEINYFNWEQDLGIPGLRKSKEKYHPAFLLEKVTIGYKGQ